MRLLLKLPLKPPNFTLIAYQKVRLSLPSSSSFTLLSLFGVI